MGWKPTTVLSVEKLFMYKANAVANKCMLWLYVWLYFYNKVFQIKRELYSLKVSPQPPVKNSGYATGWTQSNQWPWKVNIAIKLWTKNI
jgi:hypothetical protein